MEGIVTEIVSGSGGVLAGGGLVWYLIGNKIKEMAKDIHILKELAVNDKLQDQRIENLETGYKNHHDKLGEQAVKHSELDTKFAVMDEKLNTIIKLLEKKS